MGNNNYINTHHNNTSHSTNQNTNQQPSTCLHQTLTHQMRASLARSPTRSRTPPTTSPRPSRATLLRPTRRLSKLLTLHTSPTTIIRRMHDGMELNAGPMATCDHQRSGIIVSPRYLHTPMNEI